MGISKRKANPPLKNKLSFGYNIETITKEDCNPRTVKAGKRNLSDPMGFIRVNFDNKYPIDLAVNQQKITASKGTISNLRDLSCCQSNLEKIKNEIWREFHATAETETEKQL